MKQLTVIWFDNLKGIGEGFDSNGEIHFINSLYINWIINKIHLTKNDICKFSESKG
jgi:hypothetical protein